MNSLGAAPCLSLPWNIAQVGVGSIFSGSSILVREVDVSPRPNFSLNVRLIGCCVRNQSRSFNYVLFNGREIF